MELMNETFGWVFSRTLMRHQHCFFIVIEDMSNFEDDIAGIMIGDQLRAEMDFTAFYPDSNMTVHDYLEHQHEF